MVKKNSKFRMEGETANIVLVGLIYDSNLGDQAIYESTFNIVKEIIGDRNIEVRSIDLYGRIQQEEDHSDLALRKYAARIKNHFFGKTVEQIEIEYCKQVELRCEEMIGRDTIAVIFVGGGLIKYNHQIIASPMIQVLKYCNDHNIPTMLSAVGVEGFDEQSEACKALKEAINLPCVKVITTRDDLDTLRRCYIDEHIYTSCVADPACRISSLYSESTKKEDTIGLSVCRAGLFTDYEKALSEDDMIMIWSAIYSIAKKRGFRCSIITNGLPADYEFAKKLVKQIGDNELLFPMRPQNVHELIKQISSCKAIIATRLHATIIAYSYDIPFVGLVWNNKQIMFGEAIHRSNAFIKEKDITPDIIWDSLMQQMGNNNYDNRDEYSQTTVSEIKAFLNHYL